MASRSANADEKQEGDNATTLKKRENRAQGEGEVKEEREGEREEECAPRKVPDREKRERGPRRSAKKTNGMPGEVWMDEIGIAIRAQE